MKRHYYKKRESYSRKWVKFFGISLFGAIAVVATLFAYQYYTGTIDKISQIETGTLYTQQQMQEFVDDAISMAKEQCSANSGITKIKENFGNIKTQESQEISMSKIRQKNIEDDRSSETFAKLQSIIEIKSAKELQARKNRILEKLRGKKISNRVSKNRQKKSTLMIKEGDTIYSIAMKRYKNTKYISKILKANPKLKNDPHRLKVGEKIILPL